MKMNTRRFLRNLLFVTFFPMLAQAQEKLSPDYVARESAARPDQKAALAKDRQIIQQKNLGFSVGLTGVFDRKLDVLAGVLPPTDKDKADAARFNGKTINQDLLNEIAKWKATCKSDDHSYDARNASLIPAIRDQQCGDCWAYSSVGVLEISDIKVNHVNPPTAIDLSEHQIVTCSNAGSCSGGWPYKVLDWMSTTHPRIMNASQSPDNGMNGPCPATPADAKVEAWDWGMVDKDAGLFNIASVAKIKEAICTYGSVSCCVNVTTLFQHYAKGVYNETASTHSNPSVNHAIILIGWDDSKHAWLLRNSWGTNWGDGGYMWINYDTNNIGYGAIWVVAREEGKKEEKRK